MQAPSPRFGIEVPNLTGDAPNVPRDLQSITDQIEAFGKVSLQGTKAQRLALVIVAGMGRMDWYETDTGDFWYHDGSSWLFSHATSWAQFVNGSFTQYGVGFIPAPFDNTYGGGQFGPVTWTLDAISGSTNGSRLVPNKTGRYSVEGYFYLNGGVTGDVADAGIQLNANADSIGPNLSNYAPSQFIKTFDANPGTVVCHQELVLASGEGISAQLLGPGGGATPLTTSWSKVIIRRVGA